MDFRVKVIKKSGKITRYIVQRKFIFFWINDKRSEECYYFTREEAERSIQDIKNWQLTSQIIRTRNGRIYIKTSDFFSQPKIKKIIEKINNSQIIKDINKKGNQYS